jgi:hypothetical protein
MIKIKNNDKSKETITQAKKQISKQSNNDKSKERIAKAKKQ